MSRQIGFIVAVIFCFGVSVFSVLAADKKPLIIRGSDNYPPLEFLDEHGRPAGFNVDLCEALMKELGYKYSLELYEWDSVLNETARGRVDVILGMIYSPERAEQVRFTLPTCVLTRAIVTRQGDDYRGVENLSGREVLVEKGGWSAAYLRRRDSTIRLVEYEENLAEELRVLSSGKYDAVMTNHHAAYYAIRLAELHNLQIHDAQIEPQNYSMAVDHENDKLLYDLNLGLQRLKSSGKYDQIYSKWFGIYEASKTARILIVSLCVFGLVAGLLATFVWLLRRQVAKSTHLLSYAQQEIGMAIDAGNISAWSYVVETGVIAGLHGNVFVGQDLHIEQVYDKIHPDDRSYVRVQVKNMLEGQEAASKVSFRQKPFREQDGDAYRYMEVKMLRVAGTKDQPFRIVGTIKDVTEEMLMKQSLQEYRIKTKFVVDTNDMVLLEYDVQQHVFMRLNEDENETYTTEQYFGMIHPDDLPIAQVCVDRMNQAKQLKVESEFRMISNTGVENWYNFTAVAYRYDNQGNIICYIGIRRNMTRWKKINGDLVMLREKAEVSNRLKSAFLANMSHEIRTPLNAIVGFSELIAETDDPQERQKFMDIVRTNNTLLLQLIGDVLDLSRIESGTVAFKHELFDFPTFFHEQYMSLKIKQPDQVELVCVNRCDKLNVYSDQYRIAQVIRNFVTNAFKFTKKGSVTMEYELRDDGLRVAVVDTGIGIKPEDQDKVFERFEKLNEFAQGTGLGLAICREIIEVLNGKIGVRSQWGEGTEFWFWIPIGTSADTALTEEDGK